MFKSYGVEVPGMVSKTNYRLLDITGFLKYSRIMTAWQWRKLCWRWWLVVVVESFFQSSGDTDTVISTGSRPTFDHTLHFSQCLSWMSLAKRRIQSKALSSVKWVNSARRGDRTILSTKRRLRGNIGRSGWKRTKLGECEELREEPGTRRLNGTRKIKIFNRRERGDVTYCDKNMRK